MGEGKMSGAGLHEQYHHPASIVALGLWEDVDLEAALLVWPMPAQLPARARGFSDPAPQEVTRPR